jgi:hypothetical protein
LGALDIPVTSKDFIVELKSGKGGCEIEVSLAVAYCGGVFWGVCKPVSVLDSGSTEVSRTLL